MVTANSLAPVTRTQFRTLDLEILISAQLKCRVKHLVEFISRQVVPPFLGYSDRAKQ